MKIAWRALVAFGALLALIAMNMDTTLPGTRIVNLGLIARQQTFLILGCALFLGGLVLFAAHKTRQTKEEAREEAAEAQERIQKASESAKAIDQGVRRSARSAWDGWLVLWSRVRRPYVLAAWFLVFVYTVMFPKYLITDYINGGIKTDIPTTMLLGTSTAPLMLSELVWDLCWRALFFTLLFWRARP